MSVHLEGMGLSGSLLAHRLALYGVPFTWHDIDAPHTAWKASTGAIYPAGAINHGPDQFCYDVWKYWFEAGQFAPQHLERADAFVFCTKNPPHKGTYPHVPYASSEKLRAGAPSFHLNAQSFVQAMRDNFAHCRVANDVAELAKRDRSRPYIVTHGWGDRLGHAYWGWTRLVEINSLGQPAVDVRQAFYFRPDRFSMAYAYPVPGTPWWYAGSNIIKQAVGKFKDLDALPKYERWKTIFEREGLGLVKVGREGPFITGWRPAAAEGDEAWVRVRGNKITLRPLWNSGIRHFPQQWAGVAPLLGLIA